MECAWLDDISSLRKHSASPILRPTKVMAGRFALRNPGPPNSTHTGRVNTCPSMRFHIDEGVGCVLALGADLAFAGSQPDHAFSETDGFERSQKDTKAPPFEFRRPHEEPPGHSRTCHRDGSGP